MRQTITIDHISTYTSNLRELSDLNKRQYEDRIATEWGSSSEFRSLLTTTDLKKKKKKGLINGWISSWTQWYIQMVNKKQQKGSTGVLKKLRRAWNPMSTICVCMCVWLCESEFARVCVWAHASNLYYVDLWYWLTISLTGGGMDSLCGPMDMVTRAKTPHSSSELYLYRPFTRPGISMLSIFVYLLTCPQSTMGSFITYIEINKLILKILDPHCYNSLSYFFVLILVAMITFHQPLAGLSTLSEVVSQTPRALCIYMARAHVVTFISPSPRLQQSY